MREPQITTKPINSDKLWYRSSIDGKIVYMDSLCYYESNHFRKRLWLIENEDKEPCHRAMKGQWRNFLDDKGRFGHVPINVHITSDILSMVNDFCVSRVSLQKKNKKKKGSLTQILHDFDVAFIEKNRRPSLLVRLMEAASELEITSLLDITSKAIADIMVDLKSEKKFFKMFNVPDFTHEVWDDPSVGDARDACARYLESTSAPRRRRQQPSLAQSHRVCVLAGEKKAGEGMTLPFDSNLNGLSANQTPYQQVTNVNDR